MWHSTKAFEIFCNFTLVHNLIKKVFEKCSQNLILYSCRILGFEEGFWKSRVVPLFCFTQQFCRKVWLGLYDSKKDQAEPDSRDEQKIKDFMAQKYERKRWYQAPTESMKEEARQVNEAATNRQPPTRQLKTLLGEKTPQLVIQNQVG